MDGGLFRARVFLFLGLLPACLVHETTARADAVNGEWVSTTRSLTMGNLGIASAEDPTTATFYNPAALARAKKASFEVFNPQFDLGTGLFSSSPTVADWGKHLTYTAAKPLMVAAPGKVSSAGVSLFPNVTAQNFSFGILARTHRWSYYDSGTRTYHVYSRWLVVPTLGLSFGILGNRVRFGAAVRGVQITETSGKDTGVAATTTVATQTGFGIGLDAGMLLTLPWSWLPTLAGVARNVGDTSFPTDATMKLGGTAGTVTRRGQIKMTYDAGFSLSPKLGQRDTITLGVDYRDVLNKTNTNEIRHFNAGLEFGLAKKLYLRGGFSQGYWTAGIGLASKEGSFDMGTYADELHATNLNAIEDRKFSFRFTRRF